METKTLTESDLAQFTGSETWYRHPLMRKITFTSGVKFMADKAGAHWLLDIIVSHQLDPKVSKEPFQVWTLTVDGNKGNITCEDGNGNEVTHQHIEFTDFPLKEIKLWFTDNVILLPSEY
jgi:hypothetical protein